MVYQGPYNHYVTTSSLKNQCNRHLQEPSVRIAKPVVLVMIAMVVWSVAPSHMELAAYSASSV